MIERAFVINLAHRQDKLRNFLAQTRHLTSLPEIQVWTAVRGDTCNPPELWTAGNGAWGCYKSHLNILEYCLNAGIGSYIVFEDDAIIRPDFNESFSRFYEKLPEEWEQIYLGGQLQHEHRIPSIRINEEVIRPYNVNRTHCFAVSSAGMLPMYKFISNLPFHSEEHVDHQLGRWHELPTTKVYTPNRWLVGQFGFSSDVSAKIEEPTFFPDPIESVLEHWLTKTPVCIYYDGPLHLLKLSRSYLHQGHSLTHHSIDITLVEAARFKDPEREIAKWYGWIRMEAVKGGGHQLPCFYHPAIDYDTVVRALPGCRVIRLQPQTVEDIQRVTSTIKQEFENGV